MSEVFSAHFHILRLFIPGVNQKLDDLSASYAALGGEVGDHAPQDVGSEIGLGRSDDHLAADDGSKQIEFNSAVCRASNPTSVLNSLSGEPLRDGRTPKSPTDHGGDQLEIPVSERNHGSVGLHTSACSNASHKLRVSTIKKGEYGKANNTETTWGKLIERLKRVTVDHDHTQAQFLALDKDGQTKAKDVGAYVLGQFDHNRRKRENIHSRSGVALDIDSLTLDQIDEFKLGFSELWDYEFFAVTSRSHTTMAPKWRILFPTKKMIPAEHFMAVSTILSSKFLSNSEDSMDAIDEVTHRVAQVMFFPSRSRDGEFEFFHNEKKLLDHEALLASYDGWEDYTKLPHSPKRGPMRPGQRGPAERPNEKKGFVGDFCRAFSVSEAMERFIPGVYVDPKKDGRDTRYTYSKGHGAKGAVIYDGDLFLYSYHGSDPCGTRLVNAFDMVRLHLFGDQDKRDDGMTASQQPSWKAMVELCKDDPVVGRAALASRFDVAAMFDNLADPVPAEIEITVLDETGAVGPSLVVETGEHDDLLGPAPGALSPTAAVAVAPPRPSYDPVLNVSGADGVGDIDPILGTRKIPEWMTTLEKTENNEIKSNVTNLAIILQNDPRIHGAIGHNEFSDETVLRRPMALNHAVSVRMTITDVLNGDHWQDHHDAALRILLEASRGDGGVGFGLKVAQRDLKDAVENAARANVFNPVKEIWESVTWDGKERLPSLFIDYLGAEDNEYHREVAVKMVVALVTRVYEPGHKFDFMAILEGVQGIRKSTFLRTLSMDFFAEMSTDFEDTKKAVETMRGALIVEMPELQQFNRSEVNQIKAFVSSSRDKVRMAYARHETIFKRRSVFFGSTNEDAYLRDATGNRRFWPVKTNVPDGVDIDTDRLASNVPQLYAEALVYYRRLRTAQPYGTLPLYLNGNAKQEALRLQETRRVETDEDVTAGLIEEWLNRPIRVSAVDGLDDANPGFNKIADDGSEIMEGMGLREKTCMFQLFVECLSKDRNRFSNVEGRAVKNAMRKVPGWIEMGRASFPGYGQQRVYVRVGSAYEAERRKMGLG